MKSRLFMIILLIFACAADKEKSAENIAVNDVKGYIGLRYGQDSNIEGIVYQGGNLLKTLNNVEYGISNVLKDSINLLWLEKLTHRDAEGKAYWEIRDVLVLPTLLQNEGLFISVCKMGNQFDTEIIAVGELGEEEAVTNIRKAWRANRSLEKFQEIPTDSVTCINEMH